MKPIIWIVAALVIIGGGYIWYSGQKATEQTIDTPAASGSDETQPTASTESTTEAATEAATDATETATEAATDATEATEEATATTETATEAATEAATDAAGDAGDMGSLLTLDGFDMDKVVEAIDGSDLSAVEKTTLTTGLNQAKDNPELLKVALDQVKSALGL